LPTLTDLLQNDPYEFEVESNGDHGSGDESGKKGWRMPTEKKRRNHVDDDDRAASPAAMTSAMPLSNDDDLAQKREASRAIILPDV
jgi:hypothetical protein